MPPRPNRPLPYTCANALSAGGVKVTQAWDLNMGAASSLVGSITDAENYIRMHREDVATGTTTLILTEFTNGSTGAIYFYGQYTV